MICRRALCAARCRKWNAVDHGRYRLTPREHFIGDNADTLDDANRVWRDAVIKARRVGGGVTTTHFFNSDY